MVQFSDRVNALVLFYVLAQSADTSFLFSNREFKLLVEAADSRQIFGAE